MLSFTLYTLGLKLVRSEHLNGFLKKMFYHGSEPSKLTGVKKASAKFGLKSSYFVLITFSGNLEYCCLSSRKDRKR